ncbi:hypothetical protein QN277_003121 [Acacia crassicarpa]|uniref:DUF4283 domain-containing protein n=1 Tax=Acacia crassicarpa TaxID=499986 RepID=A0AAE1NCB8_9FABA|nr:hypothetical protein QN277_003121 [Acacia crassicarpa]
MELSGKQTIQVTSSTEEDDLLARSSKKVKKANQREGEFGLGGQWPKLGEKPSSYNVGGPSFVDKLKGTCQEENEKEEEQEKEKDDMSDDSMSDDSVEVSERERKERECIITEDPSRNFPCFRFSTKMKNRLHKAWSNAVVVKLLGRTIGFRALEKRLQAMWAKRGIITLINVGHGYYVVKLTNRDDYSFALTGGPWLIYDHYLIVKPWEANFRPDIDVIEKAAVWVRIPKLPLQYYDEEALTRIGNRIGKTLKVDMNTSCQLRGHFARICVLVELSKQMMQGFLIENEAFYLEYEGLHMLCTSCGVYGHRFETCPQRKNVVEETQGMEGETRRDGEEQGINDSAGKWKIVQKARRPRKMKEKNNENQINQKVGSRFEVLAEVEEINDDNLGVQTVINQSKMTSMWKPTGQLVQCEDNQGREKMVGKTTNGQCSREEVVVAKIVEGAVTAFVQQSDRRVEKRAREGYEDKAGEILMITTGEENVETDCIMETERGKSNRDDGIGPVDNVKRAQLIIPNHVDPGESLFEDVGPGDGKKGPDMDSLHSEDVGKDLDGDVDSSMVPETPI